MAVLGVDGWRGRWVGALLDGRSVRLPPDADLLVTGTFRTESPRQEAVDRR